MAIAWLTGAPGPARAHESEQYSLPAGRDFADLGPYFTRIVYQALLGAVADANRSAPAEAGAEDPLQAADFIAGKVWERLFLAFPANELLDAELGSVALQARYPGLVTLHWPAASIYDDPLLLLDLSKAVRSLFRAGTVSAAGIEFGTDKIIHFINLGRIYHVRYIAGRQQGLSPREATAEAIAATSANPLTSENGLLGLASTGIRSNGDLAADYAGLLFYRNLSEPVRIGTRELPPLLRHDGGRWQMQALPDSDFFSVFITPHWNEVLNPNTYLGYVGARVREQIRPRCADTLDHYRDALGRPRGQAGFAALAQELATFQGEPYGHESDAEAPVSVASVCFDAPAAEPQALQIGQVAAPSPWPAPAARADLDGETPLHAATRAADTQRLQQLLAQGADPNHAALYGVTPLLLAAERGNLEATAALLRAGADPNLPGPFGKTALHASVMRGQVRLTEALLAAGARPMLPDDLGNTALHLAAAQGDELQVQLLLARGADPGARNVLGARPADEAQRLGYEALARQLAAGQPVQTVGAAVPAANGAADGQQP